MSIHYYMKTTSYRKALTFCEAQLNRDDVLIILRLDSRTYHSKPLQAWSLLFKYQQSFKWMKVS